MNPQELHVSIDVGCYQHTIAVGLADGKYLGSFDIDHNKKGFANFFKKVEEYKQQSNGDVSIAMEGYNGHARPLDSMIQSRNYKLLNVNNLKLARFKEIFPSPAKTDAIDARKGLELFQLQQTLPLAKNVLQEVHEIPKENKQLKFLSRRRKRLVFERVRIVNALQSDLRAVSPGLVEITKDVQNQWFLNFLSSAKDLKKLARKTEKGILKIKQVGKKYCGIIREWQKEAIFSEEIEFISPLIQQDISRIKAIEKEIKILELSIRELMATSRISQRLYSINGFGEASCSELAGEIGTIKRFKKESSLAIYLGMSPLDNSSGIVKGAKSPKQMNKHAKSAMMSAVDHHRKYSSESSKYYDKKRAEGKAHNQAIRSLGRHLVRVIYKMLIENRDYILREK
jgi:transposase